MKTIIDTILPILSRISIFIVVLLGCYIFYSKMKAHAEKKARVEFEKKVLEVQKECSEKMALKDSLIMQLSRIPKTQINVKKIKDKGMLNY